MKYLFLSVLVAITFLFTSCNIKEVEVGKLEGFNIVKITKEYITLDIATTVKNDNNFGFTIQNVKLNVDFNNISLGKIDKVKKIRIARKSNDLHHFVFNIPLKDILNGGLLSIPALLSNRANIKVTGFVKASTWLLFSKKIDVNYNKKIKIGRNS